jgi:predicted nucleic acid-binding protein
MVAFLLDTMVLSELRRRERDAGVVGWIEAQRPSDLYLSVVTLSEIERGILRQRRINPQFAEALASWLDRILQTYSDRLLPVGVAEARRWGILSGELGHAGADLLIAATALEHGLTVVTRNLRHFVPTGVEVLDPFAAGD